MSAIRVGLIGLPSSPPEKYRGAAWAAAAHLPYLLQSSAYTIAALCNTSVESAKNAVKIYHLPESTKTYGSVEDLAADPDIDLVVACVRVDRHYLTAAPALRAGKAVFVEWPLGSNLKEAEEMAALAKKHNARNVVGIQGSLSPIVQKVKELVDSGRIGKLLSSSCLTVPSRNSGGATEQFETSIDYLTQRAVGGNLITIGIGHALEYFEYILGDFNSFDSLSFIGHPEIDIVGRGGTIVEKGRKKDVPDQITFHSKTSKGSIFTFYLRGGPPFPGTPTLDWRIHGSSGEIRITSSAGSLNVGHPDTKIELHDHKTGKVEVVEVKDEFDHLPLPARNIARVYELFAKSEEGVLNFEHAVGKHRIIEELFRQYDATQV